MLINLTEYFKVHNKVADLSVSYENEEFEGYKIVTKEDINFTISSSDDGKVNVRGSFEPVLAIPCARCLKEVETAVKVDIDADFIEPDNCSEEDLMEQEEFMDGYELDTTKLINNELIMSLPMKILCKEDCKGLCLKCGYNLNDGDCGCDRFVPDPRMAAIQDIFNAYNKEV